MVRQTQALRLRLSTLRQSCLRLLQAPQSGIKKGRSRRPFLVVPEGGLEPPHLSAHEPESCVSTNSTTRASSENEGETKTQLTYPRKKKSRQITPPKNLSVARSSQLCAFQTSPLAPNSPANPRRPREHRPCNGNLSSRNQWRRHDPLPAGRRPAGKRPHPPDRPPSPKGRTSNPRHHPQPAHHLGTTNSWIRRPALRPTLPQPPRPRLAPPPARHRPRRHRRPARPLRHPRRRCPRHPRHLHLPHQLP